MKTACSPGYAGARPVAEFHLCPEKVAALAAEKWLSQVDAGNYAGSWREASTYFQGAV